MPLTFPSHAAVVVPLKVWKPRWFDGVALVVGSAAPDVAFLLQPWAVLHGHTWWGLVWFALPVTLFGVWVIRRAGPAVAAHLPGWGRDYGVLGAVRHPWWITVLSALIGAASHRLWDSVTHVAMDREDYHLAFLTEMGPLGREWHTWLHVGSTCVGAVVVALYAWRLGRRGTLREWHGEPVPHPVDRRRFWWTAGVVGGCLVVASVLQPSALHFHIVGVRWLLAAAVGLLAGAWAVRRRGEAG